MASRWSRLWHALRGREEVQRYTVDDYARWLMNGQFAFSPTSHSKTEDIEVAFSAYCQQLYKSNGVVFAVSAARMMLFTEARFQFQRLENGRPTELFGSPDLAVLEKPWPNGTTGELLARMEQDVTLSGNFYAVRDGDRLRRLRPDWVSIVLSAPPAEAVASDVIGYQYTPGGPGGDPTFYTVDEVAHWSPIPDPEAQYRGMSWLTPVLREIQADRAATTHKLSFFENGATLGPVVSLKETVTEDQFKAFVKAADQAHKGTENAYRTMYVGGGADVTMRTADFRQLDFRNTQGAGETRIAAAGRVPPIIVGLSEGLQAATYSNYGQARRAFGDHWARPQWRSACAALETIIDMPEGTARLWYDHRDVAFLREDRKDAAEIQSIEAQTLRSLLDSGWTADSAKRAMLNEDWHVLEHSGLFSVQLQPPGSTEPAVEEPVEDVPVEEETRSIERRHRSFDPTESRDSRGRWSETPGEAAAKAVADKVKDIAAGNEPRKRGPADDKLKLAGRIDLGPGERLAGSAAFTDGDGGLVALAATQGPAGRHLRVGTGIYPEDQGRWSGADRGATVILDDDASADFAHALEAMAAAGDEGREREKALSAEAKSLKQRQRAIVHTQYPDLSKAKLKELDQLDEQLPQTQARLDLLMDQQRQAVDRLSPASRRRWDELEGRVAQLRDVDSVEAGDEIDRLRIEQARLHDERETSAVRVGYEGLVRRRQTQLDARRQQLASIEQSRAELTANEHPLSTDARAELDRLTAEYDRVDRRHTDLVAGEELAHGVIPGKWGDLVYEAEMSDTLPLLRIGVRHRTAPEGWSLGDDNTQSPLNATQARALAQLVRTLRSKEAA